MSNTNMVLGSWRRDEWPEYITVSHDGMREPGRMYVPERTCHQVIPPYEPGVEELPVCSACGGRLLLDDDDHYCPHCGARVVGG